MSYHGMGISTALQMPLKSPTVQAPLQVTNLPNSKGALRLDGPVSRRIEKASGQRSIGISVPAGLYKVFFRPQGGRYNHLGQVRVPKSGSVTFDASGSASFSPTTQPVTSTTVHSGGEEATAADSGLVQPVTTATITGGGETVTSDGLVQRTATLEPESTVSPGGRGFALPGGSAEPEGGGEAEFVYEPEPGSDIQPRQPGGGAGPSGGGSSALPGGGPSGGGAGPSVRKEPSEAVPAAPPEEEGRPAWVPWAIGAGVIAVVGVGAWWLTR